MKKPFLILMLLTVVISQVSADSYYLKRKNCWGFISWRHKAGANVWMKVYNPNYQADGKSEHTSCNPITVNKYGYWKYTSDKTVHWLAKAWAGNNGQWGSNIVPGWSWMFGAGGNTDMQPADYSYAPMMYEDEVPNQYPDMLGVKAEVANTSIDFDEVNHTVTINGLEALLVVDDPDMANSYSTFKVWILDATGVDHEDAATEIASFQAFILDGELILVGDLSASDFTKDDLIASYTATNMSKVFQVNANISLDDIIVKIGTDAGNLGQGVNPDYAIDFNKGNYATTVNKIKEASPFRLDILGNPATGTLVFTAENGTKKYAHADISIFANDGKTVKHVFAGELAGAQKKFQVDIADLPTGNYYLQVKTENGQNFVRKFIKQ